MTSTSFNVGLNDEMRSTSRVLRPPGGGHTDIFGPHEPEPLRTGRRQAPSAMKTAAQPEVKEDKVEQQNGIQPSSENNASPQVSEVAQVSSENGQAAPEPQQPTEAKPENPKKESPKTAEPPKVEAPKRVRVPPGGFSSGLW